MRLTKTLGLAIMATAFLFSACHKNDEEAAKQTTCKLAKSVYYDQSGAREDSALFTYTGNNITQATATDYYYTYEYAGERVSKRNLFGTGETTPAYFQQITYNTDGTPAKIETRVPSTGTNSDLYDRMDFQYNSGKIQKIDYTDFSNGTAEKLAEFTYTYTGSNITSVDITDLTTTPSQTYTFTYGYDSNPNYLKKQNSQIHFLDPFFGDADPTLMPLALSANNVTSLGVSGQGSTPLSYTLDEKQNLKDIKASTRSITSYTYQCQ